MRKKVAVLGMGSSGLSALKLAYEKGDQVWAISQGVPKSWQHYHVIRNYLDDEHLLEDCVDSWQDEWQMLVISPGVDLAHPIVVYARDNNIAVLSELEFASSYLDGEKIIAVTGTNGKTTTCTMLAQLFDKLGLLYFLGGNIGTPLSEYILQSEKVDYLILEASSFQLELPMAFKPNVAAILNISSSHGERYQSDREYAQAKFNITKFQSSDDVLLMPENLLFCRDLSTKAKKIIIKQSGVDKFKEVYDTSTKLLGEHNWWNAFFVYHITCSIMGEQKVDSIFEDFLKGFRGLAHRLEFISSVNEIQFYNDAKSTNWQATLSAISSLGQLNRKIILISGGKLRNNDKNLYKLGEVESLIAKVLLIGESAVHMKQSFGKKAVVCHTLTKAFDWIRENIDQAIVLFSPGFPSFDQYKNYQHRGESYRQLVKAFEKN